MWKGACEGLGASAGAMIWGINGNALLAATCKMEDCWESLIVETNYLIFKWLWNSGSIMWLCKVIAFTSLTHFLHKSEAGVTFTLSLMKFFMLVLC